MLSYDIEKNIMQRRMNRWLKIKVKIRTRKRKTRRRKTNSGLITTIFYYL